MTMQSSSLRTRANTFAPLEGLGSELNGCRNQIKAVYDFSVLGGAVGSVNLLDSEGNLAVLPNGAIIQNVLIDVVTAPTSGGAATIALTAQTAGDLKAALAIASYTGLVAGIPVNSAATSIKLTAQRNIVATIAAAALTAGKINLLIDWSLGN